MRKEFVLFLVGFLILLNLSLVLADGGFFPRYPDWVSPGEQRAIIFHEGNVETLILTSSFRGNAKELAWIVPTPTRPDVTKANEQVFTNIQKLTTPQYNYGYGLEAMSGVMKSHEDAGVVVIESKQVDYYDVNVLLATSSADLVTWFNKNNYIYPEEYAYVLNYYIQKGWYFTAIKISPEAQGATEVIQDLKEGHPTPIKMVFLSEKIVFPLKISSVDFKPKDEIKYGAAKDEPIGATRKDEDGNIWTKYKENGWAKGNITYRATYGPAADEPIGATRKDEDGNIWTKQSDGQWKIEDKDLYGEWVKNEYGNLIPTGNRGYEGTGWGNILIDEQPGGVNYDFPGTMNDNYADRFPRGINYEPYDYRYGYNYNYIPIHVYIIAYAKYEADQFRIDYGNWFKKSQIEDLGLDEEGNPFISPSGKKYFITYLTANLQKSQMDDDIFFNKANDNKKVNAGPEWWQVLVYGLLIGFFLFMGWVFTPFGILFIIGILILFLAKNKVAKIFGWIMTGFSLAIVCVLGVLVLIAGIFSEFNYVIDSMLITGGLIIFINVLLMVLARRYKK